MKMFLPIIRISVGMQNSKLRFDIICIVQYFIRSTFKAFKINQTMFNHIKLKISGEKMHNCVQSPKKLLISHKIMGGQKYTRLDKIY